ncbi:MAG: glycoside hydrolase family 9 protein [Bacteroidales bacterium]|nr:glycoside hydrolase family 9 protein [Bacteroidales bacterium]MDT8374476.1 glycoside hydrolase family 9 protein [Bacteroidales bacterium]
MKTLLTILTPALLVLLAASGCGNPSLKKARIASPSDTESLLVNQVGYRPEAPKVALIRDEAAEFEIIDAVSGKKVFAGTAGEAGYWELSGDTVRAADFSELTRPGTYRLCLEGTERCSAPFSIGDDVYREITKASVKSYYLNRSGQEITDGYGTNWARPAGHPDTAVIVHPSAASAERPAGTVISSPGGWYDAGDYNKYVVNSSITNWTLLLFYQQYPDYCRALDLNIPESDNDIADLVDELLYNLRWYLTMQDPYDGGVYHKLTTKSFSGFVMPHEATETRYVVQKSTAAALDFAAVTAMAYRVFADDPSEELCTLAAGCLEASDRAMSWAEAHPTMIYMQPPDISTGAYGDNNLYDELFWARAERALAQETAPEAGFLKGIKAVNPSWNQSATLGLISLALSESAAFTELREASKTLIIDYANELVDKSASSPYLISLDQFAWGSNSDVANQALIKIIAMRLTNNAKYMPSLQADVNWLLGTNPAGYCFVTGFGALSPMNIHHRPSGADGVPEPVPGFLAGGPNTVVMNDCQPPVPRSSFPAKSYTDNECSYSTNEIAINWNAPLVFVLGAMDNMIP